MYNCAIRSTTALREAAPGQGGERAPGPGIRVRDLRQADADDNLAEERRADQAEQLLAARQRVSVSACVRVCVRGLQRA